MQAAVRAEAHASLEPVRKLPQVLAAALPLTDVTIGQVAQAGPLECALSSGERDWLQTTMKQQLEDASEQIIASQVPQLSSALMPSSFFSMSCFFFNAFPPLTPQNSVCC